MTARRVYIVGHNMPGYLPESDPYIVGTLRAARQASRADAGYALEGNWDQPTEYRLRLSGALGDYWVTGDSSPDYHYWVTPASAERVEISGERCACCEQPIGEQRGGYGGAIGFVAESCWYVALAECYVCRDCVA